MSARFVRFCRAFYTQPSAPTNLAVCRILFYGLFAWMVMDLDPAAWGAEPAEHWSPNWSFRLLQLPHLPEATMQWMQRAWLAALVLSAIGCGTPVATTAAFVLGFYLCGFKHGYGKLNHGETLPVITLAIMMMSRCGAVWSVDALIRRWWTGQRAPAWSSEYTWPVRLVQVMIALAMLAAGIIKLRASGLEWIFSDNLAMRLIQAPYVFPDSDIRPEWTFWAAHNLWIYRTMAGLTVLFETAFPLALFSRKACVVLAGGMFMAQVSIIFLLGPNFQLMMIGYAFFIPWHEIRLAFQPAAGSVPAIDANDQALRRAA